MRQLDRKLVRKALIMHALSWSMGVYRNLGVNIIAINLVAMQKLG